MSTLKSYSAVSQLLKKTLILCLTIVISSCGNKKALQLPEINHSEITEITDVSPAYLFYDKTKADNVELNRKNLISSTNWLINVDKRLTLKQAIPHIKYLQDKKANSSHKKKGTKNYFTCNDTNRKDLGFIEFTNISYHHESLDAYSDKNSNFEEESNSTAIGFGTNDKITIASSTLNTFIIETTKDSLSYYLNKSDTVDGLILLNFNEALSFQSYIEYKSIIKNADLKQAKVLDNEFIFN